MSGKPGLRLVSSFSEKSFKHRFTISLNSDVEEDAHLDVAYLGAMRFYVHQKIEDLGITDYRVFIEDDKMEIHFSSIEELDDFKNVYEDRANHEIHVELDPRGKKKPHQLENIAHELTALAWEFGVGGEIKFEANQTLGTISVTALNRDAFVTFFQEYEYTKDKLPFAHMITPETLPHLIP